MFCPSGNASGTPAESQAAVMIPPSEVRSVFADSTAGYDEVDVRVKDHRISTPRMQYSEESGQRRTEPLGILEQRPDRACTGLKDGIVAVVRTGAQQRPYSETDLQ